MRSVTDLLAYYYSRTADIDTNQNFVSIITSCRDAFIKPCKDVSLLSTDLLEMVPSDMTAYQLAITIASTARHARNNGVIDVDKFSEFINLSIYIFDRTTLVPQEDHFHRFSLKSSFPHSCSVEQLFLELTTVVGASNLSYDNADQDSILRHRDPRLALYYLTRRCLFRNQALCEGLALSLLDRYYDPDGNVNKYYNLLLQVCGPRSIYLLRAAKRRYPYKFDRRLTSEDRRVLGLPYRQRLSATVKPLYGFLAAFYTPANLSLVRQLTDQLT